MQMFTNIGPCVERGDDGDDDIKKQCAGHAKRSTCIRITIAAPRSSSVGFPSRTRVRTLPFFFAPALGEATAVAEVPDGVAAPVPPACRRTQPESLSG